MKLSTIKTWQALFVLWLIIGLDPLTGVAQTTKPRLTPNALPYTLEFVEKKYTNAKPLPRLQSYAVATSKDGKWIIAGGRRQGLHTFENNDSNFVRDSANNFLFIINPLNGESNSFDVNKLSPKFSAPLQATNQQHYYDKATDQFYLIGGYGWKADKSDMVTFNTIIRFKVDDMIAAIKSGQSAKKIEELLEMGQDDLFAVTGGELFRVNSVFYLVFGQRFDGQYRAFGGTSFEQTYTEAVRVFTLDPNKLTISSNGPIFSPDPDRPFHRRDGNIINDIDPVTGKPRIAAFGGVFKPGIIDAYKYPVYISAKSNPISNTATSQKFSQYNCPVITVYDGGVTKAVYHTFFGGISHYYYSQTKAQKSVYDLATSEHRNDGFPFIADITTLLQSADGVHHEYIHPKSTPGNRLIGSSVPFLLHSDMINKGYVFENEVIDLTKIPKKTSRLLIGYVYGGVEAQNPLPVHPNTGTFVSNSVIEVYMTYKPFAAISADQGHESTKDDSKLMRR